MYVEAPTPQGSTWLPWPDGEPFPPIAAAATANLFEWCHGRSLVVLGRVKVEQVVLPATVALAFGVPYPRVVAASARVLHASSLS